MPTAKCIAKNIAPLYVAWFTSKHPTEPTSEAASAIFLGRLVDRGEMRDLYVTPKGEYLARHGDGEADYGSLGDLAPAGTPYAFAAAINARRVGKPGERRRRFVACMWSVQES